MQGRWAYQVIRGIQDGLVILVTPGRPALAHLVIQDLVDIAAHQDILVQVSPEDLVIQENLGIQELQVILDRLVRLQHQVILVTQVFPVILVTQAIQAFLVTQAHLDTQVYQATQGTPAYQATQDPPVYRGILATQAFLVTQAYQGTQGTPAYQGILVTQAFLVTQDILVYLVTQVRLVTRAFQDTQV